MRLTAKERRALREFTKPRGQRDYAGVHANSIHALERKGLITNTHKLTKAGRDELKVPNVFDDLFPAQATPKTDPDRALAAAEVLEEVWLNEQHFELEHKIDDPPVAETDNEGHVWVTVKIHVPALDIDCWLDGTHIDLPQNRDTSE